MWRPPGCDGRVRKCGDNFNTTNPLRSIILFVSRAAQPLRSSVKYNPVLTAPGTEASAGFAFLPTGSSPGLKMICLGTDPEGRNNRSVNHLRLAEYNLELQDDSKSP